MDLENTLKEKAKIFDRALNGTLTPKEPKIIIILNFEKNQKVFQLDHNNFGKRCGIGQFRERIK